MIEGRLVRLRAPEPDDLERYLRWFNDPEVTHGLAARYPMWSAREREWLAGAHSPSYQDVALAVETLADRRHVGSVGLHRAQAENRTATLGIAIGERSLWGKGLGADVLRTACRFGFEEMNLHKVDLVVHATNPRAQALYERVGFRVEAVAREAWYQDGAYVDMVHMGLFRDELVPEDA